MLTLTLTTSTKLASVSLYENDSMLVNINVNVKKTHSTNFLDELSSLFSWSDKNINDVENILISVGPGSFTGIRMALATVKGAFALNDKVNIYKVNELDALAYQAHLLGENKVISVIDSNKEKIYYGIYENNKRIENQKVGKLIDAINYSKENGFFLYGDAIINYRKKILENGINIKLCDEFLRINSNTFYQMFKEGILEKVDIYNLIPDYLELSQAEKERGANV